MQCRKEEAGSAGCLGHPGLCPSQGWDGSWWGWDVLGALQAGASWARGSEPPHSASEAAGSQPACWKTFPKCSLETIPATCETLSSYFSSLALHTRSLFAQKLAFSALADHSPESNIMHLAPATRGCPTSAAGKQQPELGLGTAHPVGPSLPPSWVLPAACPPSHRLETRTRAPAAPSIAPKN